jgi:hypothetical protein
MIEPFGDWVIERIKTLAHRLIGLLSRQAEENIGQRINEQIGQRRNSRREW